MNNDGVYGVSRNPMYVGFVTVPDRGGPLLGVWPPLTVLSGFVISHPGGLHQGLRRRAWTGSLDSAGWNTSAQSDADVVATCNMSSSQFPLAA